MRKFFYVALLMVALFSNQQVIAQNDIFFDSVSIDKSEYYNGQKIKYRIKYNYSGSFTAEEFKTSYLLSPTINYKDADTVYCHGYSFCWFSNISGERSWEVEIPYTIDTGKYYIVFLIDEDLEIPESNESNNVVTIPVHITKALADCHITDIENNFFVQGEFFNDLNMNFSFNGITGFPYPSIKFYFSEDTIPDTSDAYVIKNMFSHSLNYGSHTLQTNLDATLNKKIPKGYYHLFAELDPLHELEELNEDDNMFIKPGLVYLYDTLYNMELNDISTLHTCKAVIGDNGGDFGFYFNSHSSMDIFPNDTNYRIKVELHMTNPIYRDQCSPFSFHPFTTSNTYTSASNDGLVSIDFNQFGNFLRCRCENGTMIGDGCYDMFPSSQQFYIQATCVPRPDLQCIKTFLNGKQDYPYITSFNLKFAHLYKNEGTFTSLPSVANVYLSTSYNLKDTILKFASYPILPLNAGDNMRYTLDIALPDTLRYNKDYYLFSTYIDAEGMVKTNLTNFQIRHVAVAGTATASKLNVCPGTSTQLSLTGYTGYILWEESQNGLSGWKNVTGGTASYNPVYTTVNLSAEKYYRAKVWEYGISNQAYSNVLHIVINPVYNVTRDDSVCQGRNYQFGTQVLTQEGQYSEVFQTIGGCDSIVSLSLKIKPVFNITKAVVVCPKENFTFEDGTTIYNITSPVDHASRFLTFSGCDSIIETSLAVNVVNTEVTVNKNVLTSAAMAANYQWIDCSNYNEKIPNEKSQSFTTTQSGSFAVIVNNGSCADTFACQDILYVSMNDTKTSSVKIYPNPTNGIIFVEGMGIIGIKLHNTDGKLIKNEVIAGTDQYRIDLSGYQKGMYFIMVTTTRDVVSGKIIVE